MPQRVNMASFPARWVSLIRLVLFRQSAEYILVFSEWCSARSCRCRLVHCQGQRQPHELELLQPRRWQEDVKDEGKSEHIAGQLPPLGDCKSSPPIHKSSRVRCVP